MKFAPIAKGALLLGGTLFVYAVAHAATNKLFQKALKKTFEEVFA